MLAFNALGGKPHLSRIGEGYSATSVNTAVFRANSLATHGDTQYASYYDPEGILPLRRASSALMTGP